MGYVSKLNLFVPETDVNKVGKIAEKMFVDGEVLPAKATLYDRPDITIEGSVIRGDIKMNDTFLIDKKLKSYEAVTMYEGEQHLCYVGGHSMQEIDKDLKELLKRESAMVMGSNFVEANKLHPVIEDKKEEKQELKKLKKLNPNIGKDHNKSVNLFTRILGIKSPETNR